MYYLDCAFSQIRSEPDLLFGTLVHLALKSNRILNDRVLKKSSTNLNNSSCAPYQAKRLWTYDVPNKDTLSIWFQLTPLLQRWGTRRNERGGIWCAPDNLHFALVGIFHFHLSRQTACERNFFKQRKFITSSRLFALLWRVRLDSNVDLCKKYSILILQAAKIHSRQCVSVEEIESASEAYNWRVVLFSLLTIKLLTRPLKVSNMPWSLDWEKEWDMLIEHFFMHNLWRNQQYVTHTQCYSETKWSYEVYVHFSLDTCYFRHTVVSDWIDSVTLKWGMSGYFASPATKREG